MLREGVRASVFCMKNKMSICLALLDSIYLPCGKFDMFSLRSNSI